MQDPPVDPPDRGSATSDDVAPEHPAGSTPVVRRRPPVRRRAVVAWVAVVLGLGLVSGIWGVTTASVEASLGPHVADYQVTTDGQVSVDLGPLGALVVDSPLPLRLGADVAVAEIPRDVTELGEGDRTLQLLEGDLERYVQFFASPEVTLDLVVRGLVVDAVRGGLIAWAVLVGGAVLLRLVLGRSRRAELAALGRRHRVVLAAVVVVSLAGAAVAAGLRPQAPDDTAGRETSAVFDGTPLEGARITGRLSGVVDLVAGFVTEQVQENEAFYAAVQDDLDRAWRARSVGDAVAEAVEASRLGATGGEATGGAAGAGPTPAPTASPTASPTGAPETVGEVVTLLVVSDLHCNIGMAPVIGRVAELSGTDVVLDAGDTTTNGTEVEETCVSAFAAGVPDGVPVVVADGNHDSAVTSQQEADAGWTVLDGEVVEVAGLRVLGDSDPDETRLLEGTRQAARESLDQVAERLAGTACDDEVDLLLVHDPRVGQAALERGCVPAQVSGHFHTRTDPEQVGEGIRYISSSTAGAVLGELTVGPLNGVAEMTLLRVDADAGEVLDWRLVEVATDTTVTVGRAQPWPTIEPGGAPGQDDAQTAAEDARDDAEVSVEDDPVDPVEEVPLGDAPVVQAPADEPAAG